jgi:hypothetical protein
MAFFAAALALLALAAAFLSIHDSLQRKAQPRRRYRVIPADVTPEPAFRPAVGLGLGAFAVATTLAACVLVEPSTGDLSGLLDTRAERFVLSEEQPLLVTAPEFGWRDGMLVDVAAAEEPVGRGWWPEAHSAHDLLFG